MDVWVDVSSIDCGQSVAFLLPGPRAGSQLSIFCEGKVAGFIGARYVWEFHNSSNFQGNDLALSLTLAKFD